MPRRKLPDGEFPRPVKVGSTAVRWKDSDITGIESAGMRRTSDGSNAPENPQVEEVRLDREVCPLLHEGPAAVEQEPVYTAAKNAASPTAQGVSVCSMVHVLTTFGCAQTDC